MGVPMLVWNRNYTCLCSAVTIGFAAVIALSGCTAQYTKEIAKESLVAAELTDQVQLKREHNWVIPSRSKLYLAYPDVGLIDEDQPITRTQFELAQLVKIHFTRYFANSVSQPDANSLAQTFKEAQQQNADFLLVPELITLSANPHADGERKRIPNQMQLSFRLFDVRSKKLLDSLSVQGQQGMLNWKKQQPAVLFKSGVQQAASALAGEAR